MFDLFKSLKCVDVSQEKSSEPKKDKKYIAVIAVFAGILLFTFIRALFDPTAAQEIRKLHISIFDILVLAVSLIGCNAVKRKGNK